MEKHWYPQFPLAAEQHSGKLPARLLPGATEDIIADSLSVGKGVDYAKELRRLDEVNKRTMKLARSTQPKEMPYKCSHCSKAFTRAFILRNHIRSHTGEKPFVCTVCGKQFTREHDRKSHEATHSGDKQFACTLCKRRFSRSSSLKRHHRNSHHNHELVSDIRGANDAARSLQLLSEPGASMSTAINVDDDLREQSSFEPSPLRRMPLTLPPTRPHESSSSSAASGIDAAATTTTMPLFSDLVNAWRDQGQARHIHDLRKFALSIFSAMDGDDAWLANEDIARLFPADIPTLSSTQTFRIVVRMALLEAIMKRREIEIEQELPNVLKDLSKMMTGHFAGFPEWKNYSQLERLKLMLLHGRSSKAYDRAIATTA